MTKDNNVEEFVDYTHMRRVDSEIMQAQMTILRALRALIPRGSESNTIDEIDHSLKELTEFYYEGKHEYDGDDPVLYADARIELKTK